VTCASACACARARDSRGGTRGLAVPARLHRPQHRLPPARRGLRAPPLRQRTVQSVSWGSVPCCTRTSPNRIWHACRTGTDSAGWGRKRLLETSRRAARSPAAATVGPGLAQAGSRAGGMHTRLRAPARVPENARDQTCGRDRRHGCEALLRDELQFRGSRVALLHRPLLAPEDTRPVSQIPAWRAKIPTSVNPASAPMPGRIRGISSGISSSPQLGTNERRGLRPTRHRACGARR
jgi:hypothetical protein